MTADAEIVPDAQSAAPGSRHILPPRFRPPVADCIDRVAPLIHSGDHEAAAKVAIDWLRLPVTVNNALEASVYLQGLLRHCLDSNYLAEAASLLWSPNLFTPEPRSVRMIWNAIEAHESTLLQGASSMGKTYTPGVLFFLRWLQDPEFTNVICIGPTQEHLESNLFTHLVKLHTEASLALPGTPSELFIGSNRKNRRAGIRGVVIPIGKRAAGRVQGTKRHPRPKNHPIFGKLSRLFILLDELENIPEGLFSDIENVQSQAGEEPTGFRLVGSYNPKDPSRRPYKLAEPVAGWRKFDIDLDEEWDSKSGWRVVRLDAELSENVQQRRVVYSGLQTFEGAKKTTEKAGGVNSPGHYTFVRGAYPPGNLTTALMDLATLESHVGKVQFMGRPTAMAGVDCALEGGDGIKFAHGMFGPARGYEHNGTFHPFLVAGRPAIRSVLQLNGIYTIPGGPAPTVAESIKSMAIALAVRPDCLTLDRTGNGAGVHDILRIGWDIGVQGVNFFESPSQNKILEEDIGPASETCHRMDSELGMAARAWTLYDYVWFAPEFDSADLNSQFTDRQRFVDRGLDRIESKKDFKARNAGKSPDDCDSFFLLIHGVRCRFAPVVQSVPTDRGNRNAVQETPPLVDLTNQLDDLE